MQVLEFILVAAPAREVDGGDYSCSSKFKLNIRSLLPILVPLSMINQARKGARVVESTGLENRNGRKAIVGSNPTPSAHGSRKTFLRLCCYYVFPAANPFRCMVPHAFFPRR